MGNCYLGKCTFGKLPLGKLSLGKSPLRKYLTPFKIVLIVEDMAKDFIQTVSAQIYDVSHVFGLYE